MKLNREKINKNRPWKERYDQAERVKYKNGNEINGGFNKRATRNFWNWKINDLEWKHLEEELMKNVNAAKEKI